MSFIDQPIIHEGVLLKWTNVVSRYKKRFFRITEDHFLVYKEQKGNEPLILKKRMDIGTLLILSGTGLTFVVSDGLTTIRLKAMNAEEKEKWLSVLRVTKSKLIYERELDESEGFFGNVEITDTIEKMTKKQAEIKSNESQLKSLGASLTINFEDSRSPKSNEALSLSQCADEFVSVSERSLLLIQEFLQLAEMFATSIKHFINSEKSQVAKLQSVVQELGQEQTILEQRWRRSLSNDPPDGQSEDIFFDANESTFLFRTKALNDLGTRSLLETFQSLDKLPAWKEERVKDSRSMEFKLQRRKIIPERLNQNANFWEVLKNSIGKDLSKISLPVNYCEPLSLLQRLTEDLEYSFCLDEASSCSDPWERFARVAAYTVSCYSSTASRFYKPFNPLLGETYECDRRTDMGWRSICEQVSHHPPIIAMHAQSSKWTLWQEQSAVCKFRGKYFQVTPIGIVHLILKDTGDFFTWGKANTTVHSIIMGNPWIENYGDIEIINHTHASKCLLKYFPFKMLSKEPPFKVTGMVYDKTGLPKYVISGTWSGHIEGAEVISQDSSDVSKLVFQTAPPRILWKYNQPPSVDKFEAL